MNKGIESSKGEFLIFIGADDTFNQSEISNFVETLNNNNAELILFEVLFKGETKKRGFWKKEGGITTQLHWTLGQPRIYTSRPDSLISIADLKPAPPQPITRTFDI